MELTLENQFGKAVIATNQGGTLKSLSLLPLKASSIKIREVLMPSREGKSGLWPDGGMPILFPAAGRVWHQGALGNYHWGEVKGALAIHGFLYTQKDPKVLHHSKNELSLTYSSTGFNKAYPWSYEVTLTYLLSSKGLSLKLKITNRGYQSEGSAKQNPPMPCSPGFHPYFALDSSLQSSNGKLSCMSQQQFSVSPEGAAESPIAISNITDEPISNPKFQNLILSSKDNSIQLEHPNKPRLKVSIESTELPNNSPYWVLWGKEEQEFYCIEPWVGLPDAIHNKKGLVQLAKGQSFNCKIKISIHGNH